MVINYSLFIPGIFRRNNNKRFFEIEAYFWLKTTSNSKLNFNFTIYTKFLVKWSVIWYKAKVFHPAILDKKMKFSRSFSFKIEYHKIPIKVTKFQAVIWSLPKVFNRRRRILPRDFLTVAELSYFRVSSLYGRSTLW